MIHEPEPYRLSTELTREYEWDDPCAQGTCAHDVVAYHAGYPADDAREREEHRSWARLAELLRRGDIPASVQTTETSAGRLVNGGLHIEFGGTLRFWVETDWPFTVTPACGCLGLGLSDVGAGYGRERPLSIDGWETDGDGTPVLIYDDPEPLDVLCQKVSAAIGAFIAAAPLWGKPCPGWWLTDESDPEACWRASRGEDIRAEGQVTS